MRKLTVRQRDALEFIRSEVEARGVPPTCAEIAGRLGSPKSKASALCILDALMAAGYLRRRPNRARAIELLQDETYHRPDCDCDGCAETRYFEQLKLVHALQFSPPAALVPKLKGLRPVSELTKVYWLRGFPRSLRPRSAVG
jgi:SOS-response transcriptional repressor LexA